MGTDKALLPHPEGGSWLERTLRLLLDLGLPVTLLSRHERHLQLARELAPRPLARQDNPLTSQRITSGFGDADQQAIPEGGSTAAGHSDPDAAAPAQLTSIAEPEPWQGPLLALQRLMELYPDQRLLLCPVDMPWLTTEVLRCLLTAAAEQPQWIHLAHDGEQRQPLLGVYPSAGLPRTDLSAALQRGERRLQGWLAGQGCRDVRLDAAALRNVNRPEELVHSIARWDAHDASME